MKQPNAERRNPRSHSAILRAAYELALERGPAKVTIEAIAARAGVGKQTIYRWWPSKGAVFLDVFNTEVAIARDVPNTGDIAADLRAQMIAIVKLFNTDFGRFYAGLIAEAQGDPDLGKALAETIAVRAEEPRQQRIVEAQQQGHIRPAMAVTVARELLFAPLHYRLLLGTAPLDEGCVDDLLDGALKGLLPRG